MIQDIILTSLLILLPVSSRIFGKIPNYKKKRALNTVYVRGISGEILRILLIFFNGLLLGKAYQYSGTVIYPIILHFSLNATIIVLSWKEIKKNNQTV